MSDAVTSPSAAQVTDFSWGLASFRQRPLRWLGVFATVFLRLFMGVFYLFAGVNKLRQGYLWSDYLKGLLEQRLTEIDPASFATAFLTHFAIPLHMPTAYVVCLGEIAAGVSLLFGLAARSGAALALFFILMFGIGGYYDASLIPLGLVCLLLMATPNGRWFGLDRRLAARYPNSVWFR
jgi:uncharacterized membrane protein YphA (DoxX/SURF4 family)